jgi:hypothetical protein
MAPLLQRLQRSAAQGAGRPLWTDAFNISQVSQLFLWPRIDSHHLATIWPSFDADLQFDSEVGTT